MARTGITWSGIRELDNALRVMEIRDTKTILRKSMRKGMAVLRKEVRGNLRASGWAAGADVARAYGIKNSRTKEGFIGVDLNIRRKGFKGSFLGPIFEGGTKARKGGRGRIEALEFRKKAEMSKGEQAAKIASEEILKNILRFMDRKMMR